MSAMTGLLVIEGEVQNTTCLTWSPVDLGIVGAVQIAEPFTVWHGTQSIEGRAGDYLVRTLGGTLVPIPRQLWNLLDGTALAPAPAPTSEGDQ